MKKYIVQVWNKIEIPRDSKEEADELVQRFMDDEKFRDFQIFEVTEERKEL